MAKRRKKTRSSAEAPTCNCLLLCDDVLISQGKNKHSLMGIIGCIGARELPATLGGYVAYVRLSNLYGSQKVVLKFEHAETEEVVFQINAEFPPKSDPLGVYTLVLPIPLFVVRHPGRYLFTAVHDGVPFAFSPIEIKVPGHQEDGK